MKTNALLELKLEEDCCFPLTLNHNFVFQKDVLKPGLCQASSKVLYLTRRGNGSQHSTRCNTSGENMKQDPFSRHVKFFHGQESTASLDTENARLESFPWTFRGSPLTHRAGPKEVTRAHSGSLHLTKHILLISMYSADSQHFRLLGKKEQIMAHNRLNAFLFPA